jgi:Sulfotransferase domain/N-terminal domain of galactosyltransferase
MSGNPRIGFCTTVKGRTPHLKLTLPANLRDNADYPNCVFVILDYESPDDLLEYLSTAHAADIASGRVVVYSYKNGGGPFEMAPAKNLAHRCGIIEGAEILVNLDADNYTGRGFASYIADQYAKKGPDLFMWARMIKGVMVRGINGRLIVTRDQFINVGGYDERYKTWERDDKDMNERLCRMGYRSEEIDPQFLLGERHSNKLRFKEYPHIRAKCDSGDLPDMNQSEVTVVNFGAFGCGTVRRNFSSEPIELRPIPTRIFGCGLHKTGTTSLHHAFKTLGFNSAHWKNAHWAKAIWAEMRTFGKSTTLEKYYALSDLPIAILYKELDEAYPNSKFILTTRDEKDWLRSVAGHWNRAVNEFKSAWSTDPFTHTIHKIIYGQKNFDAQVMLARFRRHNAEVREYFKYRPDDFMEMKLESASWEPLCEFLERPSPSIAYPRLNERNHG